MFGEQLQLSFSQKPDIPEELIPLLNRDDCAIAISLSGGKDSQAQLNWLPIHDWSIHRVWSECGTSTPDWERRRNLPDTLALDGWTAHPAYVLGKGNHRLSCCFCVLGDRRRFNQCDCL